MMRWLDILLGRTKPVRSQLDRLFAISTAYLTLTVDQQLTLGERAGIAFRPLAAARFQALQSEIEQLLRLSERTTGTTVETLQDSYGFQWAIFTDPDFEDLVTTIHMLSLSFEEQGAGAQLLAAVFKFLDADRPVYWVYNYKRGTYYPFVPVTRGGADRRRDNATELRLAAALEKELPIEKEVERWYPLWGAPV